MDHDLGGMEPETEAEKRALKAWCEGIPADCSDLRWLPGLIDPEGPLDPTIRGEFLARLLRSDACLSTDPRISVFKLSSAQIKGRVDLDAAKIPKSLDITDSYFDSGFTAPDARFERLNLRGTTILGCLDLSDAEIKGQFNAHSASFRARRGRKEKAINAQALTARGWYMRGATILGTCALNSAHIRGQFSANGATFSARPGYDEDAIRGDYATIRGGVFFRRGNGRCPAVQGRARFLDARIARFCNLEALEGSGLLDFRQADLECTLELPAVGAGGTFGGQITLEDAAIKRLKIRRNSLSKIVLTRSNVGVFEDHRDAWEGTRAQLDGLTYQHLERPFGLRRGNEVIREKRRVEWRLNWLAANVDGYNPLIYRAFATELSRQGLEDEARSVTVARRRAFKESKDCHWARRWFFNVLDWTGKFGFDPARTSLISIVLILSCALVYDGATIACDTPTCREGEVFIPMTANDIWTPNTELEKLGERPYRSFDPLLFSMDTFIPLVDFGPAGKWTVNNTAGHVFTASDHLPPLKGSKFDFSFGRLGTLLTFIVVLERILGAFLTAYLAIGLRNLVVDQKTE